jgi:hypothetical protein
LNRRTDIPSHRVIPEIYLHFKITSLSGYRILINETISSVSSFPPFHSPSSSLVKCRQDRFVPIVFKIQRLGVADRALPSLSPRIPIPQVREAIPRYYGFEVEILPSWIAECFCVVERRPAIDCNDLAIHCATFVPASTVSNPDGALKICLNVLVVFAVCVGSHHHRLYRLGLELCYAVIDVDGLSLDGENEGPIGYWIIRSDESYIWSDDRNDEDLLKVKIY